MQLKDYKTSIIIAVIFAICISAFWFMPQLAFIVFLSLLLQLLLEPIVSKLSHKIPRGLAAVLVLLGFILIVNTIFVLVVSTFVPTLMDFISDFPDLTAQVKDKMDLNQYLFVQDQLDNLFVELKDISILAFKNSLTILLSLANRLIDAVIIFFVAFYLLKDGKSIKFYLAHLFPHRDNRRIIKLFNCILSALRVYICSQLIMCLITASIVFAYFSLRGLPYASVFAMLSGLAEFIPVLGPTVASVFGTMLTGINGIMLALQTGCFYLILTQINHNIVYPYLVGKSLHLHPIAIILGIILGGELLSAAGMFLAVPIMVVCKIVIADIYYDRLHTIEHLK